MRDWPRRRNVKLLGALERRGPGGCVQGEDDGGWLREREGDLVAHFDQHGRFLAGRGPEAARPSRVIESNILPCHRQNGSPGGAS